VSRATPPVTGSTTLAAFGPLRVIVAGGETVRPRGGKQAQLLATLLVRAPRIVTTDALLDRLWPDDPPEDPIAALYVHVSRLRSFLKGAGLDPAVIEQDGIGYRLRTDGVEVDLDAFESAACDVLDGAGQGDHDDLLAAIDHTLALVTGEPFENLGALEEFASRRRRLGDLRQRLLDRRVELLLESDPAGAVRAAERRVADDPLRERARELHLRALHRVGRRSDALAAYQDYRLRLSEELGLDPSVAIERLHLRILDGDDADGVETAGEDGAPVSSESIPHRPMVPARGIRPTLPASITPLVARESELATLARLLETTRLLTLTGTGGVGKTRLALESARRRRRDTDDEVAWVGLGTVTDPSLVSVEIGRALRIPEAPDRAVLDSLATVLGSRPFTLVLDNCEHVIEAVAEVVTVLLGSCPRLTVVATSREPLKLGGEVAWPVPTLSLPPSDVTTVADASEAGAVTLFVTRAREVRPDFVLDDEAVSHVVTVCRTLDGLPLALELAASRLRALGVRELAERLDRALSLLSGGSRDAEGRHRTQRAAIEWSTSTLSSAQGIAFDRLSVFVGGFDLDAAEAVITGASVRAEEVLDLVCALVDRSLLVSEPRDGRTRYRMLEVIRQYGAERLEVGGETDTVRTRHAEHFTRMAEAAEPHLLGPRRAEWSRRLHADVGNFRAALIWCEAVPSRDELLVRMAGSLWRAWHFGGAFTEARRWTIAAADRAAGGETLADARALYAATMATCHVGDPERATRYADPGLRVSQSLHRPDRVARALSAIAYALLGSGEIDQALTFARECLETARAEELPITEMGCALITVGDVEFAGGLHAEARRTHEEILELSVSIGDTFVSCLARLGLARIDLDAGNTAAAATWCRDAIRAQRDEREPWLLARSLGHPGHGARRGGGRPRGGGAPGRRRCDPGRDGHHRPRDGPARDRRHARDARRADGRRCVRARPRRGTGAVRNGRDRAGPRHRLTPPRPRPVTTPPRLRGVTRIFLPARRFRSRPAREGGVKAT